MKKSVTVVSKRMFPRDKVWGAAVASQRVNGEYVKRLNTTVYRGRSRYRYSAPIPPPVVGPNKSKLANVALMRIMLDNDSVDVTPEDYEKAEVIRAYYCSMITLVFSGDARDFVKNAVDAATTEEIPERGSLFPLIASLPSVYATCMIRNEQRNKLRNYSDNSIPLDEAEAHSVHLNVTILDCIFKDRFGSNAINALVNNIPGQRVVFFFDRTPFVVGESYNISGLIKKKGNQTTQLHYVRNLAPKRYHDST